MKSGELGGVMYSLGVGGLLRVGLQELCSRGWRARPFLEGVIFLTLALVPTSLNLMLSVLGLF